MERSKNTLIIDRFGNHKLTSETIMRGDLVDMGYEPMAKVDKVVFVFDAMPDEIRSVCGRVAVCL